MWRARRLRATNLGASMSNAPMTHQLDDKQYLVAGAGDTLFGFVMNK